MQVISHFSDRQLRASKKYVLHASHGRPAAEKPARGKTAAAAAAGAAGGAAAGAAGEPLVEHQAGVLSKEL